jgi:hypothetical protein
MVKKIPVVSVTNNLTDSVRVKTLVVVINPVVICAMEINSSAFLPSKPVYLMRFSHMNWRKSQPKPVDFQELLDKCCIAVYIRSTHLFGNNKND